MCWARASEEDPTPGIKQRYDGGIAQTKALLQNWIVFCQGSAAHKTQTVKAFFQTSLPATFEEFLVPMAFWLIAAVLLLLAILLVLNTFRPALIFTGAVAIFMFAGLLDATDMLRFYTDETLIGLILLLQASTVVERTHFVPIISRKIFSKGGFSFSLFKMSGVALLLSTHLNNTAIVASLMGAVRNNRRFPAGKLLMPLSFAAIMGGVITLIGTSTNLIVNSFVIKADLPSLGFYDFAPVGIPLALVGMIYVIFVLPRMLPHKEEMDEGEEEGAYFLEAVVMRNSELIGRTVEANGLRNMDHLFLAEIIREDRLISPARPEEILEAGDTLVFAGAIRQIQELKQFDGLDIQNQTDEILTSNLQEVVIKHNAPIIGRRVKDVQFRTKFDAVVVAVKRGEGRLSGKIGQMVLQPGDDLVLAVGSEFTKHANLRRNFIFLNPVAPEASYFQRQSYLIAGMFFAAVLAMALQWISLFKAMALLCAGYMILRFMSFKEFKRNLNLDLLLMIGSALGMAHVMQTQGIATMLGEGIIGLVGSEPYMALMGVYIATVIVTELITNNAAAALMFPIALATAQALGCDPKPFIMAIAYAASASFLTPVGYQTNTMVFSVGGYTFKDFIRGGIGLSLLYGAVVVGLTPYFFPFYP